MCRLQYNILIDYKEVEMHGVFIQKTTTHI